MPNHYALTEFGHLGEIYVAQQLRQRGYTVELIGQSSDYDLLIEGQARAEVKSATVSNGRPGRRQRWQFSLRRHQQPVDEDLLFLLCYQDLDIAPITFIIPGNALPDDLTKIDITSPNPATYAGKWAEYRDAWRHVARVVSRLPARKPRLFRPPVEEAPIPF